MALDLKPLVWDWAAVTTGDTFPATNITESDHDSNLSRVRISIWLDGATSSALNLDSNGATIVINDAAAWDFTINAISVTLAPGLYFYDLETTDAAGVVRTEFVGSWEILTGYTA
jgi:hypothetical protein